MAEAKHREISNLKDHVFEEVDDEGQEFIDSKWIVTEKIIDEERVVKSFQKRNKNNLRTDSPTCTKENLRIMLTLTATNSWKAKLLDIKHAYLQGKEIEWLVYVKPPVEVTRDKLRRLKKAIYGLYDAARVR